MSREKSSGDWVLDFTGREKVQQRQNTLTVFMDWTKSVSRGAREKQQGLYKYIVPVYHT